MVTYGRSDCGNYLCHLLWTYSIWVSSPRGNSWKWVIWVMERGSRWQSSGKINRAWCIFPTSTSRQMWFNTVIGFTSSSWISVDKLSYLRKACANLLVKTHNHLLFLVLFHGNSSLLWIIFPGWRGYRSNMFKVLAECYTHRRNDCVFIQKASSVFYDAACLCQDQSETSTFGIPDGKMTINYYQEIDYRSSYRLMFWRSTAETTV